MACWRLATALGRSPSPRLSSWDRDPPRNSTSTAPARDTGAGNYSRVIVTGAANTYTAAGTLLPLLRGITGSATNSYTPPIGQDFLVVSAQGGLVGSMPA